MKYKLVLVLTVLTFSISAAFSQTDLTIKKKSSMKIPGMPDMPQLPAGMPNPMGNLEDGKSIVYVKGSRMRNDMKFDQPKRGGGKETVTQTTIVQCDTRREFQFNSKKKKYYVESTAPQTSATTKNSKKGGYVTITGSVIDTGERAKLFGFDARHLKGSITFTPSKNACMKETMQIEIEGWYADIPEFSCPVKRNPREFQMDKSCFDDVDSQMKGGITGIALKEIKTITTQGMTMTIEEEVIEILRTPIANSMFEPPANYKAANTLKEVEDDSPDDPSAETAETPPQTSEPSGNPSPTFALPAGGVEKPALTGKKAGMIRIGIAKPKVTTPESKKDPDAGDDLASAVTSSLVDSLKAENVEAIALETDFPENEAAEKGCDYIFYANVTQKRSGGGMFGKMLGMGAISMAGARAPGVGGAVASTAAGEVMSQTMGSSARAKDEFTLDCKVVGLDKAVLSQAVTKSKTKTDGEDVMTPQIQQAAKTVLEVIAAKN